MRRRWPLLALWAAIYTILIGQLGWVLCAMILASEESGPFEVFERWDQLFYPFHEAEFFPWVFVPAAALTITQMVFLLPVVRPPRVSHSHGRSLAFSVVAAGFCGSMLAAGLMLALIEGHGLLAGNIDPVGDLIEKYDRFFIPFGGWWMLVAVSWMLWTPLVIVFARRNGGPRLLSRMVTWLFAGTVVEVLVVVPLDIMVRRRTNCYCGTGTAAALCFSVCSLLWLSGPGIVLAVLSKRRRLWWDTHCAKCGYEKGPSPGERCPECGYSWCEGERALPLRQSQ